MAASATDGIASVEDLQRVIDPDVWAARYEDQTTIGQQWSWETRRRNSTAAARRVHAFLKTQRERESQHA